MARCCQRVLVNGSKSSWSPVTSGIPQGSVLGPVLFVCYINDMPDVAGSPIHMFADDTKIFRQMTTQSDQVTDKLRALKLPSLYYRRARGDMIETYKYLHGIYKVDKMPLEQDNDTVTRGHSLKLKKERVTARQRRHYFRHRVVNRWNTLTEYVVLTPSLNIFKSKLDKFWCAYSFEKNYNFPPMRTNNCQDQLKGYTSLEELKRMYVCMYVCMYV